MYREEEAAALGLDTSKQTEGALSVHAPLAVAAWKGKGSLNVLVSKGEQSRWMKPCVSLVLSISFCLLNSGIEM